MRTTQQLSITLPTEMAEAVKTKVKTALKADPSRAVTPDQVRARLAAERTKAD